MPQCCWTSWRSVPPRFAARVRWKIRRSMSHLCIHSRADEKKKPFKNLINADGYATTVNPTGIARWKTWRRARNNLKIERTFGKNALLMNLDRTECYEYYFTNTHANFDWCNYPSMRISIIHYQIPDLRSKQNERNCRINKTCLRLFAIIKNTTDVSSRNYETIRFNNTQTELQISYYNCFYCHNSRVLGVSIKELQRSIHLNA